MYPTTPDGRYFVVKGQLWRCNNPLLEEDVRQRLVDELMAARKELAAELHYTGSNDDSVAMNIWLHSAVIKQLTENGGKVPADLLN